MSEHVGKAGRKGGKHYSERCHVKRQVKARELSVSELLTEPVIPEALRGMTFVDLLAVVPYLPTATFEAMMEEVPIKLTARLEDPVYRKRRLLADRLGKWEAQRADGNGKSATPHAPGEGGQRRSHKRHSAMRARTVA
jgi:hypothetical protein